MSQSSPEGTSIVQRKIVTHCDFEREPLGRPFGFKGGFLSELWQVVASMRDADGRRGIGLGVQSVLWADARVFAGWPEAAGNAAMFLLTRFALQEAQRADWNTPIDLLDQVFPATYAYGQEITGRPDLLPTFALNALVAVDNAAWLLYAREREINDFDALVPEDAAAALSLHHPRLANVPLVSYDLPPELLDALLDAGASLLKIKIGADPNGDGDLDTMLEWDKARLSEIHQRAVGRETPFTENGRVAYYLDANGRYDTHDRLLRLLDHADRIGALPRILLVEEPFPETHRGSVHDLPVRVAADESAHSVRETAERIEEGYGAIALKPIAKTLSMTLRIARVAHERGVPCFCADLTGSPLLVEWNRNVAARLAPLPGMKIGILEVNGPQYYKHWERMMRDHPRAGAPWTAPASGCFTLDEEFYRCGGGLFDAME